MKKLCLLLFVSVFPFNAIAVGDDFRTTEEILNRTPDDTKCATAVFANALAADSHTISEYDDEQTVQQWIYDVFAKPDVLTAVLECPELKALADDDTIRFMPIQYNFPNGRQIVVNYETQPHILKQRLNLASKRTADALNDPNPKIGALGDESIWTNTDPAWYAIMVVQHGAFDNFVGPDKNNTVSLKYITDNIDSLYPRGATCTSKSALANDDYIVNLATHETVGVEKDTNDYYVAGDANLQWISYTEIALDVVITVVTFGGGAILTGIAKSARATRALNKLRNTLRILSKSDKVVDYIRMEQKLQKTQRTVARLKKYKQLEQEISKLRDAAKIADKTKDLEKVARELREIDKLTDAAKYTDTLADLEKEGKALADGMQQAAKTSKEVEQYVDARRAYSELQQYRRAYKNFRNAKAGNIATRAWRAFRATTKGEKTISRGAKIARQSMKSGRVRDWLFQSTMRNIGRLGKLESAGGLLYGTLKIAGDMYDWTETSTGDYTNGIEFRPLLLLSADDLEGQENVINHGMWLMWAGDAVTATDDDAAYLQAFDFADKFHMDLLETMEKKNSHACDVDIYVARPVLRNPDSNNPELYYLIMNDKPWTTAE